MSTRCPNCGALFPSAQPGQVASCTFCDTRIRIPDEPSAPQVNVHVQTPKASSMLLVTMVCVAVAVGVARWMIASRSPPPAVQLPIPPAPPATAERPRPSEPPSRPEPVKPRLTLETLATTPLHGREPIEAPGMSGTLEAFNAVANVNWARSIARAWTRDAELHRLQVERCDRDGLVNLKNTPGAQAMYRFLSFERIKELDENTSVTRPETEYELFVFVTRDGPMVQKIKGDPWAARDKKTFSSLPACTLAQAFAALDKAGKLPLRPVYDADFYLSGSPSWKIQTLTREPQIPSVTGLRCSVDR